MSDSPNAPLDCSEPSAQPSAQPAVLVDPNTLPCLSVTDIRPDGSVRKRLLVEGKGRLIPGESKVWVTLEGRKASGEYFQREVRQTYILGQKGSKVVSPGLLEALFTLHVGDVAWVYIAQNLHFYPVPGPIWIKMTIEKVLETIESKLRPEATLDEHCSMSERLVAEANCAVRAQLFKESIAYYNRALDCLRVYKAKAGTETLEDDQKRISQVQLRCELNMSQALLSFSEVANDDSIRGKRLQEALLHANIALSLSSDSIKGWYRKAKASLLLGDVDTAREAAKEGLRLEPGNKEMRVLAGKVQAARRAQEEEERRTFRGVLG